MSIVLQPISNPVAQEHYMSTIVRTIDADIIKKYQPSKSAEIDSCYPDGRVRIWGVVPGVGGRNSSMYDKIKKGDIVLFSSNGIVASARVTMKFYNAELARVLWGETSNGDTWECIYLIENLKKMNVPKEIFNKVVDYKENYVVRGFSVIDDPTRVYRFEALFDMLCEL